MMVLTMMVMLIIDRDRNDGALVDVPSRHSLLNPTLLAEDTLASCLGGLQELSLHGCRRLTDKGLVSLSGGDCPNLRWLNATGAYKVTDAGYRCLLSTHPTLLLYNRPMEFCAHK